MKAIESVVNEALGRFTARVVRCIILLISVALLSLNAVGQGTTATPTFSPAPGIYTSTQSVTISDATTGSTIYYTTDGTTPTTSSRIYAGPITVGSSETLQAMAVESGNSPSAVATASYTITGPPTFTLAAAAQPPYVTGASEEFVVTLTTQSSTPIPGTAVTFNVVGANNTTGSSTTNSNGNASFTYTGANSGQDSIQASVSVNGQQATSNTVSVSWIVPSQAISTTTVTGKFFLSDGCGCFDTPPTATPAFVQTFPVINFNPPEGTVPRNTSQVDVYTRPFTDVTTDLNGNYTGTIVAQGNGYQAGVGPMETFQVALFGSFTVANAGNVVFNFFDDDGFVFGVGNGATRVDGSDLDMPSATAFDQLPAVGGYNVATAQSETR